MKIKDTLVAQRTQEARASAETSGILDHSAFKALKQPDVSEAHLAIAKSLVFSKDMIVVPRSELKKARKLLKAMQSEAKALPMLKLAEPLHDAGLLTKGAFSRLGDGIVSKLSLAEVAFAKREAKTPELKEAAEQLMTLAQENHDALPWLSKAFEGYADRTLLRAGARSDPNAWAKDYGRINAGAAELSE